MFDLKLFATALLSGRALEAVIAEFGAGPDDEQPVSLAGLTDLGPLRGSKVLPTLGVCQYLASDDDLTDDIIDHMDLALERDYQIKAPFFITSHRTREDDRLQVAYFYLDAE